LALLSEINNNTINVSGKIYAYDLNESLIHVYKNIQKYPEDVYNETHKLATTYNSCENGVVNRNPKNIKQAKQNPENYYYWIRYQYNLLEQNGKKSVTGTAMFIFLNKTGFRGLFRTGPNGFNVSCGHYKNPEIVNREHLFKIHELIQPVIFKCCDFTKSVKLPIKNDFVYIDPPYAPETKTSFVGYVSSGFGKECHELLFENIHKLTDKYVNIIMSNASVSLVNEQFENELYNVDTVICKRSINSKNPESKTEEVIISNFAL
jgi:DNA adenine methylase